MEPTADVDAMVAEAVRTVRDRFGPEGLRDLVALANVEIERTEQAAAALGAGSLEPLATQSGDSADTQAWMAYTGQESDRAPDADNGR